MQAPESVMSPPRRSAPPNRKRRERTVYRKEQLEELKEAFLKNQYPSYQDRLRLAARLHLDEHRVQETSASAVGAVGVSGIPLPNSCPTLCDPIDGRTADACMPKAHVPQQEKRNGKPVPHKWGVVPTRHN
ncbi:hypothetical protein JEQ12_005485 [Ovis aries]|uniref:Homeobox domain-containing protein n=1 Tax=Ovis aries TaxID=9940 RepID=A0A836CX88_SHEEP|nr:hypothetical protein JEQ12_005485 [Ovis aries]